MRVEGQHFHSIWFDEPSGNVRVIDQTRLPHQFTTVELTSLEDCCHAITAMQVRGAPLIGATAAFGVYLALRQAPRDLDRAVRQLSATRPTGANLRWALERTTAAVTNSNAPAAAALTCARRLCEEDIATCSRIGDHALALLRHRFEAKQDTLNILTHCNAGWLATVDWGTALAGVYKAHRAGIPVHVWVDETRPRNQGASLTAWELAMEGVPHSVVCDNAGGHLMQEALVDLCLVGSDRTTRRGDVANKIGTYLKALAAHANSVPFYVALPVSSIDWILERVPIEQRDPEEVTHIHGLNSRGEPDRLRLTPAGSTACNYAFDVTPGHLVTGLVTEQGVFNASEAGLAQLREQLDHDLYAAP